MNHRVSPLRTLRLSAAIFAAALLVPSAASADVGTLLKADYLPYMTQNVDSSWHYAGTLVIPLASGSVSVPGASVDMKFQNGKLKTISGTAGFPQLPGQGAWANLGDFSSTGPALQIGYDYPSAFSQNLSLPLDPDTKYFYFKEQSGASVSWGNLSCSSPDAGATTIAIDASTPTVFLYTDQLPGQNNPIQSVAVGVSSAAVIPFTPEHTDGSAGGKLRTFDGNFYLSGEIDIPTQIPAVTVNITGNGTADVDGQLFAAGQDGWLRQLGVNGDLALGASLGPLSISYDIAGATVQFQKSATVRQRNPYTGSFQDVTNPGWLAFSGTASTNSLRGLPFTPKGTIVVDGYLDQSVVQSFLEFSGDVQFGTSFAKQRITANARIMGNGSGSFSGSASFASTKFTVSGTFSSSYATFSGTLKKGFSFGFGHINPTVTCSFDSRKQEVDLSVSVQFCSQQQCDTIGGSVEIDGNGQIVVCANVPAAGRQCFDF